MDIREKIFKIIKKCYKYSFFSVNDIEQCISNCTTSELFCWVSEARKYSIDHTIPQLGDKFVVRIFLFINNPKPQGFKTYLFPNHPFETLLEINRKCFDNKIDINKLDISSILWYDDFNYILSVIPNVEYKMLMSADSKASFKNVFKFSTKEYGFCKDEKNLMKRFLIPYIYDLTYFENNCLSAKYYKFVVELNEYDVFFNDIRKYFINYHYKYKKNNRLFKPLLLKKYGREFEYNYEPILKLYPTYNDMLANSVIDRLSEILENIYNKYN